ncbi:hypothetical protein D3C76_1444010 [compost metagenome]
MQCFLSAGRLDVGADQVAQRGGGYCQQHAVGIDHEGGVEGHALGQYTVGFHQQRSGIA